jgi:gas vesicle protein
MNDRTTFVSFLAGGLAGAAVALLLAPLSGYATRGRIQRKLRYTADSARDLTDRAVRRGEEIGDEVSRRVHGAGAALAGDGGSATHRDEVAGT